MPVSPLEAQILSEQPEALEAFSTLVDAERKLNRTGSIMGSLVGGVIPREAFEDEEIVAINRAQLRISTEHERVMCARHGHELDEDIDPTPDLEARKYLGLVGLLRADEMVRGDPTPR